MRARRLALALLVSAVAGCAASGPPAPRDAERPEWGAAFDAVGGRGTVVLYHPSTGRSERYDAEHAARRFLPASTFKLYNALVAVDAGVVTDADSSFAWDGVERSIPAWNRDHTLRSGMQQSVVWLYQRVAAPVGRDRYLAAFAREPYGNGFVGDSLTQFWLDNTLRISADEQVRFVDRLRTGRTGCSDLAEATVRDLVPVLAERTDVEGRAVRMLAKTGWGGDGFDGVSDPMAEVGWIVGWVERPEADGGDVVFALNVEPARDGFEMGPARLAIAEAILVGEGLLPAE